MNSNHADTQNWLLKLPCLINALNQPQFPKLMLELVQSVADFDSSVMMVYNTNSRPKILYESIAEKYRNAFYDRYLHKGAFSLSPLYQKFRCGEQGFFHFKEIVSDNFYNSEYYHKYYSHSGIIDQVFYLQCLDNGVAIVESLARTEKFNGYTELETNDLQLFEPVFASLIKKNWGYLENENRIFSDHLHQAFKNFGTSILTRQEKRIVNCILMGDSSKSAARKMNISVETERSYRKIIYQKLNIHSHSQLHRLFFFSLDCAKRACDQDPLELLQQAENRGYLPDNL